MNNDKYNEEIEILDGLDDLFDPVPQKKEPVVEVPTEEPVKEEEVLSVLDEHEEEPNFTTFTPDKIDDVMSIFTPEEEINSVENIQPISETEEQAVEEINFNEEPTLEESVQFENSEPMVDEIFSFEPTETIVEDPVVSSEENEDIIDFEEASTTEGTVPGSDVLEPVEIAPLVDSEVSEPVVEETPDYNIDYAFMSDMDNNSQSIDDAFTFEPSVKQSKKEESVVSDTNVEVQDDIDSAMALGKTVIIEPVDTKQLEEENIEKTQKLAKLQPKEEKELVPVEDKKEVKKDKKKVDNRTLLFVVLLIILLLACAALAPLVLESLGI